MAVVVIGMSRTTLCGICATRELRDQAEIIFCPYNYIFDPRIKGTMGLDLNNCAVVIDEV